MVLHDRDSYLQCVFANEHFKGTVNKLSTSTRMLQTISCTKHGFTEDIRISRLSLCVTVVPLQTAITSSAVARWPSLTNDICKMGFARIRRKSAMAVQYLVERRGSFFIAWISCTHNCRIWAKKNPHAYIEEALHPPHLTVWCGFTSEIIVGPLLFIELLARLGCQKCYEIKGYRVCWNVMSLTRWYSCKTVDFLILWLKWSISWNSFH